MHIWIYFITERRQVLKNDQKYGEYFYLKCKQGNNINNNSTHHRQIALKKMFAQYLVWTSLWDLNFYKSPQTLEKHNNQMCMSCYNTDMKQLWHNAKHQLERVRPVKSHGVTCFHPPPIQYAYAIKVKNQPWKFNKHGDGERLEREGDLLKAAWNCFKRA